MYNNKTIHIFNAGSLISYRYFHYVMNEKTS